MGRSARICTQLLATTANMVKSSDPRGTENWKHHQWWIVMRKHWSHWIKHIFQCFFFLSFFDAYCLNTESCHPLLCAVVKIGMKTGVRWNFRFPVWICGCQLSWLNRHKKAELQLVHQLVLQMVKMLGTIINDVFISMFSMVPLPSGNFSHSYGKSPE